MRKKMKRIVFSLVLLLTILTLGCGGGSSDMSVPLDADAPPSGEASLEDLNASLKTWMMRRPVPPSSIKDLAEAPWCNKNLPDPPPGKRYAIDPQTMTVVLIGP